MELELSLEAKEEILIPSKSVKNLKDLKNYEFDNKYVCDKNGQVYRVKGSKGNNLICVTINPYTTRDGYTEYVIYDKYTKKKHIQGQRIVAGLFLKEVPGKIYVNHKDGDRSNNKVENLEWCTHSENIKHSYQFLRSKKNVSIENINIDTKEIKNDLYNLDIGIEAFNTLTATEISRESLFYTIGKLGVDKTSYKKYTINQEGLKILITDLKEKIKEIWKNIKRWLTKVYIKVVSIYTDVSMYFNNLGEAFSRITYKGNLKISDDTKSYIENEFPILSNNILNNEMEVVIEYIEYCCNSNLNINTIKDILENKPVINRYLLSKIKERFSITDEVMFVTYLHKNKIKYITKELDNYIIKELECPITQVEKFNYDLYNFKDTIDILNRTKRSCYKRTNTILQLEKDVSKELHTTEDTDKLKFYMCILRSIVDIIKMNINNIKTVVGLYRLIELDFCNNSDHGVRKFIEDLIKSKSMLRIDIGNGLQMLNPEEMKIVDNNGMFYITLSQDDFNKLNTNAFCQSRGLNVYEDGRKNYTKTKFTNIFGIIFINDEHYKGSMLKFVYGHELGHLVTKQEDVPVLILSSERGLIENIINRDLVYFENPTELRADLYSMIINKLTYEDVWDIRKERNLLIAYYKDEYINNLKNEISFFNSNIKFGFGEALRVKYEFIKNKFKKYDDFKVKKSIMYDAKRLKEIKKLYNKRIEIAQLEFSNKDKLNEEEEKYLIKQTIKQYNN